MNNDIMRKLNEEYFGTNIYPYPTRLIPDPNNDNGLLYLNEDGTEVIGRWDYMWGWNGEYAPRPPEFDEKGNMIIPKYVRRRYVDTPNAPQNTDKPRRWERLS